MPRLTPSISGVTTLPMANTRAISPAVGPWLGACERKAKAEPRSTMPMSMTHIGTNSAVRMSAKAGGKAVNSTTTTSTSQTLLASQIGPMARAISARWAPARGPKASRSHTPAPKSAPPVRA